MNFDKCVVCGLPEVGFTGSLFMANGKSVVGMPYCTRHMEEVGFVFANPVFENEEALRLFKDQHPGLYIKRVRDKQIIFLKGKEVKKNARANANGRR